MAFSLSNSVITQSGTDEDLSGLAGISGVSVQSSAGRNTYISDYRIFVDGTLTIDPDIETLVIKYSGAPSPVVGDNPAGNVMFTVGGTLIIGREIVENEFTRYSEGLAIYIEDTPNAFHTYMNFTGSSTIIWYGGTISQSHGCSFWATGADIQTKSENSRFTYRGRSIDNQIRLYTDNFVSDAFTFVGGDLVIISLGSQINGYRPTWCTGALAHSSFTPNVEYVLRDYAGGDQGNEKDVKHWAGNRTKLYNSKTGTQLRSGPHISDSNSSFGTLRVYSELDVIVVQFGGGAIEGAKLYIKDYDNGNRRLYNQEAPSIDLLDDQVYTATSNASGVFPTQLVLTGAQLADFTYGSSNSGVNTGAYAWDYRSKNGDTDDLFDVFFASYSHLLTQLTDVPLKGVGGVSEQATMFIDTAITEAVKATVDAYTTLETPQKFYDRAKSYLVDNYAGETATIVTRAANLIDAGSYNVVIDATASSAFAFDGTTITIKATTFTGGMTTAGVITLANGATFIGTRTDANGTVAPPKVASITGITAGSRLQIYNVTTASEIVNTTLAGTSYTATYEEGTGYSEGDVVRVRLTYQSGTTAKLPYSAQAVVGASGWSILAAQADDTVYASLGIDGSTVTEFAPDFPNVQVDISDPDGSTRVDRLYAWFAHTQASDEDGIRLWFGGIVPEDDANFRIVTSVLDLKIDNTAATGVTFVDGRRLYRDDNASPLVSSTTGGGSITLFAGKVYTSVISTASPVITGDIDDVAGRVWNATLTSYQTAGSTGEALDAAAAGGGGATAQEVWEYATRTLTASSDPSAATIATAVRSELATELGRIDATVSSRNATAPDNAGIAAIKAKTDTLENTDLTGIATSAEIAALNDVSAADVVTAMQAVADDFKADVSSLASQASVDAIPTNTVLATDARLDNLDAAVSTRLSAASYVAPDNAGVSAIKAKTDNLPADPASNTQVNTRLAAASYVAPDNAGIAAIPTNTVLATDARLDNLDAPVSEAGLTETQATQLDELHTMRGLKSASPMTVTTTGESAGNISLAFTGDGEESTTVTRQ